MLVETYQIYEYISVTSTYCPLVTSACQSGWIYYLYYNFTQFLTYSLAASARSNTVLPSSQTLRYRDV